MSQSPGESNLHEPCFRIGTLLYFRNEAGRLLLIRRKRRPNLGLWCAIGGKLEMADGESPYECATREAKEEVGVELRCSDLFLKCILSEKNYEGTGHWLMFVFLVQRRLKELPAGIPEGEFAFFDIADLDSVEMPDMDREVLKERVLPAPEGIHFLRCDGDGQPLVVEGGV